MAAQPARVLARRGRREDRRRTLRRRCLRARTPRARGPLRPHRRARGSLGGRVESVGGRRRARRARSPGLERRARWRSSVTLRTPSFRPRSWRSAPPTARRGGFARSSDAMEPSTIATSFRPTLGLTPSIVPNWDDRSATRSRRRRPDRGHSRATSEWWGSSERAVPSRNHPKRSPRRCSPATPRERHWKSWTLQNLPLPMS